jgi:ferritin-like metal-binding protein YciE
VEHFEMDTYQGMVRGAHQMRQSEIENLLNENLQQEEEEEEEEEAQIAKQSVPESLQKRCAGELAG